LKFLAELSKAEGNDSKGVLTTGQTLNQGPNRMTSLFLAFFS